MIGGGLSATGIAVSIWEKFNEASATVQEAAIRAAGKPSFWCIAGGLAVCAFIWWRRNRMKVAS
jgi:hypothetical protein